MLPRGLTSLLDSVQSKTIAAAGPAAAVPAVPAAAAGAAAGAGAAGLAAAAVAAAAAGFQNPLCPDALPLAVGRGRRIYNIIYIYIII